MFTLSLARCGAGGGDCRVNDLGVSLGGNFLLCNDDLVADGAVLALGLAGFGAGGLNCRVDDLSVPLRGYFLHARESLAADRAFFAGFMTSLGAGCGLLGNFNGSMTGSSDCFCFGFVANRADVGLDTGILTGRRGRDLALIPTVALGGNLFLRYKHFIANRAMFAFGLAGCGAGSCNSFVDHLGMTRSGDFLNSGNRCAADRALCAGCVSGLGAGCGLFSNLNGSMTGSIDCFGFGLVADRAGKGLYALVFAGRFGRDLALIPLVSRCGNDLLLLNDLAANGAVLALGLAGCGAGGGDCRVGDLGVSRCTNSPTIADLLIAVLAVGIAGIAILGASGGFRVADLGVLM